MPTPYSKEKTMSLISQNIILWALLATAIGIAGPAAGTANAAPLQYRETITRILQESQVQTWPAGYESHWRYVDGLTNSADGSKIAFKVYAAVLNHAATHIYVMNADGTGLTDLTGSVPSAVDPNAIGLIQLTDDGSKLFYNFPALGTNTDIYYINTGTGGSGKAVIPLPGATTALYGFDVRKPFSLTQIGDNITLYFQHDAGFDWEAMKNRRGIFAAGLGGMPTMVVDADLLPWDGLYYPLKFLGSGAHFGEVLFTWNKDYYHPPAVAMYKYPGLNPVPNEFHNYVWPQTDLHQKIISANGSKALYQPSDTFNDNFLYLVDTVAGTRNLIAENYDINRYFFVGLSPAGTIALFQTNGFRGTRAQLATGDLRDTLSGLLKEWYCFQNHNVSDITTDDRYYFLAGRCDDSFAKIYRIDLKPTDYSQCPTVSEVWFSAPNLLQDNTTFITIMARVSDPQGLGNIDWVKMTTMVGGLEYPEWLNATPLNFWPILYDDGTHGDVVAGDGIFTNNTLRTQTSNFYQHYPPPCPVGIRIMAKDKDDNHSLVDTTLAIATKGAQSLPGVIFLLLD